MDLTRGVWWGDSEEECHPQHQTASETPASSPYFALQSPARPAPEIFRDQKAAILIYLCRHSEHWQPVAHIRVHIGHYKYSPRASQLIREIIETLERLPRTRHEPAQPESSSEAVPEITSEPSTEKNTTGERKMGTWFVPILGGELILERKTRRLRISYRELESSLTIPQQLPAPPAPWVERSADLHWLRGRQKQNGVLMAGLRGMGGSGKTSLAVSLAHEWKAHFSDGQLYLTISQESQSSPESIDNQTKELLRRAIRSFQRQPVVSNDVAELAGDYRDTLASHSVLVVLDNAQTQEQIEAFKPPTACGFIVTSRQAFSLGSSQARLVGNMEEGEAAELLSVLYQPLTSQQAATLARLCAYCPLALRIVGNALAMEHEERGDGADVDGTIKRLSSPERLKLLDEASPYAVTETVTQTLRWSEAGLTGEEKIIWWTLGVFPAVFDAKAALTIAGASEPLLEKLVRRSLLGRADSRYQLHDLVRDYTVDCLENAKRHYQTSFDHASYYVARLKEQADLYVKGGENMMASLQWFDEELINLEAGRKWACRNQMSSPLELALRINFVTEAGNFLPLRLHPSTEAAWLRDALSASKSVTHPTQDDRKKQAILLHNLALTHSKLGQIEEADAYYRQSVSIMTDIEHFIFVAIARGNWGWDLFKAQRKEEALAQYRLALDAADKVENEQRRLLARGTALQNLGIFYKDEEQYEQAFDYFIQVLNDAGQTGDKRLEAKAVGSLGEVLHLQGDFQGAIAKFEQQYNIANEIGNKATKANALYGKALVTYDPINEMRKPHRAIELAENALNLYDSVGDPIVKDVEKSLEKWRQETDDENS